MVGWIIHRQYTILNDIVHQGDFAWIKYVCICAYTHTCILTMYVTVLWQGQKQIYKMYTCFLFGRKCSTFKF